MSNNNLAPFEAMDLRELLDTEVISFKKIHANMSMVQDEELEEFMKRALDTKKKSIAAMRNFIDTTININSSDSKVIKGSKNSKNSNTSDSNSDNSDDTK